MRKNRSIFLFLGLISLVFSLNCINSTYAKYATKAIADSTFNVARWDIVVNHEHVKNSVTEIANITPNYIENRNVAAGVIAPGSVGYFDLTIDGEYTDVSFTFDIEVTHAEESIVTDLKIMKYYIDSVDNITDADDGDIISSEINVNDATKQKTVRVYIIWDEENGTMDNTADTEAGHNAEDTDASVQVKITFKQKI